MTKKLVSLLLAAVLLFACAPMAAAQRSLRNPDGEFVLPALTTAWLFQDDTWDAGKKIAGSVFEHLFTGKGDPEEIMRLMEQAPLLKADAELPPDGMLSWEAAANILLTRGLRGLYVALQETQWENEYRVVAFYKSRQGELYWSDSGICYNTETGLFHDVNTDGGGLFGLGYEYEAGEFLMRTNAITSWHRSLGYSVLFDMAAPVIGTVIDTLRFPFEYNGKDYMIQIWKGVYSLFSNGGEIGLYEKPAGRPVFWDCSDTELDISMQIYRGGSLLFDYGTQHTWWLGGFKLDKPGNLARAYGLGMVGSIAFEDPAMLKAFLYSFEKNRDSSINGKTEGMVFSFEWQAS